MLILSLFRHAKSAWGDASSGDFERPLAARGEAAAPLMGRWMADHGLIPDIVLSSPSARTRATCALAFGSLGAPPVIRFEDELYLASAPTLLGHVRRVEAGVRHLMLVGHNPGLQTLALDLVSDGPEPARARLADKLPTAGLVVIGFDTASFGTIEPSTGRLLHFVTPRQIGTAPEAGRLNRE